VGRYAIRRLILGLLLLFALTFSTYAVFSIIPYDPGRIAFAPGAFVSDAQLKAADHRLGTDKPFYIQYWRFLHRLFLHGQLGNTFKGLPLNSIVAQAAPVTALLVLGGAVLMLALAFPLAILSSRRPDSHLDRAILLVAVLGIALHPFIVGVILRHTFANSLHVLPSGGYCPLHHIQQPTGQPTPPGQLSPQASLALITAYEIQQQLGSPTYLTCHGQPWPLLWTEHMILPWITFALFLLPFYVRIIRSRLLETYNEPFVLTARAKGASESRILIKHVLRPISGTIITLLAFDLGVAITAALYIETVYRLPGLAHEALIALGTQGGLEAGYDLPTMTAIVLVTTTAIVTLNLAADLVAAQLDPRIRLAQPRAR
jgi:peptide/nickel transport system permease protein